MCDWGVGFIRCGDIGGILGRYVSSGGNDIVSVGDFVKIVGEIFVEMIEDRGNKYSILEGGVSFSNCVEIVWSLRCVKDEYGGIIKFVGVSFFNLVVY